MIRQGVTVISIVVTVGLLVGCSSQPPPVVDTRLQDENRELTKSKLALEGETTRLALELGKAKAELTKTRLDTDEWKAKYEAAKNAIPPGDTDRGGLPPELLRKFIQIAEAGGPFEFGPTGSLRASSDILFDSGKANLKPGGVKAVTEIAPKLKEILTDKRVMLRVDGHTDNTPIRVSGWEDNLHLSLMRAKAVVKVLEQQGIPAETMFAAGFGEWHPVAPNTTVEGRATNRRVELSLVAVAPLVGEPGQ